MKQRLKISKKNKNITIIILSLLFYSVTNLAQSPTHYPSGNDPVEFTPVNIIVYIIGPILLVIIYLWYRRYLSNKKKAEEEKNS
jgi:hypothetical protein